MRPAEKTKGPTKSCGNVFEDLGFPAEEAALLQLKTDLKIAIEREAERRKLTPKKLAQILDVQQPQVSDLLTGKVGKMTIDKLTKYAHRLGMRVEVKTRSPRRPRKYEGSEVA
jgi:predicted XRE-type DNA-binding protein